MKMNRNTFYFLVIFLLNQVLIGNEGAQWIASGLDEINEAAASGDDYAKAFLSLAYLHGEKGLEISMARALQFAQESTSENHWLGEFAMGFLARFPPYGPDQDKVRHHYLKSFRDPDGKMVKAAARGDPIAAYALAEIFTSDEVRPTLVPDLHLASEYYTVSSDAGYAPASVQIALMRLHAVVDSGMGIKKDLKQGIELLEKAAQSKLPAAHHYLGRSYFEGIGVESDNEMALVHFRAAADRGFATSQLTVADFYAHGVSGPQKLDLAIGYAKLALSQEEEKALAKIAEYEEMMKPSMFSQEDQSISKNVSVEQSMVPPLPTQIEEVRNTPVPSIDNIENSNRLPSVYFSRTSEKEGEQRSRTNENSILHDQSHAQATNSDSAQIRNLAKESYWGRGIPVDYEKARSFFMQASEAGDAESARYLGMMFMQGKGVTKNPEQALYWFSLAAERGDSMARSNLGRLKAVLEK